MQIFAVHDLFTLSSNVLQVVFLYCMPLVIIFIFHTVLSYTVPKANQKR